MQNIVKENERMKEIRIDQSANGGLIVHVGCQVFTYSKAEIPVMMRELQAYLENPAKTEELYHKLKYPEKMALANRENMLAQQAALGRGCRGEVCGTVAYREDCEVPRPTEPNVRSEPGY